MNVSEWSSVVAFCALVVSVLALVLSWMAYRQRIKFHPQPKLVAEWDRAPAELNGVPYRPVVIANHGDAAARDLAVVIPASGRGAAIWDSRDELEPGHKWMVMVPLAAGVDWGIGGLGAFLKPPDGDGVAVRSRVEVSWRQAPFDGRKHRIGFQAPS